VIGAWVALADAVRPELRGLLLASLRVLPLALLCPLLGGRLAPAPVRLAVAATIALAMRPLAGAVPVAGVDFWAGCLREAGLGLLAGMAAALPFDAARIGGRMVDLVRGTSAEAALPVAGHRESATADALHQLLLALALAGGGLPAMVRAIGRSYLLLPPGSPAVGRGSAAALAGLVGTALATGLSVAAPVVALSWATDAAVALALRVAPGLGLGEIATPVRILGGAAILWLSLGVAADRLMGALLGPDPGWLGAVLRP